MKWRHDRTSLYVLGLLWEIRKTGPSMGNKFQEAKINFSKISDRARKVYFQRRINEFPRRDSQSF